ncbi:hypothetical protein ACFFU1_00220 [Algibacter miyuki]|uniref:Outer membrane protein beta-barrel domain-containing protein n=1 Tax=Algibacter miyuki TaxID=1306933 RepID=A0ABV5GUJ3_9FLAO|nr:hypothetical protein [Algibacter miyuki]MDN3664633.1 hypothetical protein [Algibacter miyuki]
MKNNFTLLLFLLLISISSHGQGKIDKAEKSLKKEFTPKTITSSTPKETNSYYNNNSSSFADETLTEIVGGLFIQLFAYTAYGLAIESPFEMDHKASNAFLTKHPYNNSSTGHYSYDWQEDSEIFTTSIATRFIFETNKINGNHLNVDMNFFQRFGLELDYLQLWEKNTNFGNDNLAIYTALAKYNRVRTERFNAYWGLGAAYVDGAVNKFGFTYGLGAELFFMKPFSLESNFNQVLVNNHTVNKFNALLNYYKKQYKFSLGYEYLKLGDVEFSTISAGIGVAF